MSYRNDSQSLPYGLPKRGPRCPAPERISNRFVLKILYLFEDNTTVRLRWECFDIWDLDVREYVGNAMCRCLYESNETLAELKGIQDKGRYLVEAV
jgi:hypothetical protein